MQPAKDGGQSRPAHRDPRLKVDHGRLMTRCPTPRERVAGPKATSLQKLWSKMETLVTISVEQPTRPGVFLTIIANYQRSKKCQKRNEAITKFKKIKIFRAVHRKQKRATTRRNEKCSIDRGPGLGH